ncbi:unnamed protein product, partial [Meganyctiphanes norvegica]
MEVEDIWHTVYTKSIINSGENFFSITNLNLYTIIGYSPEEVVYQEWGAIKKRERDIYYINKDLIRNLKWSELDISAHNFLFLLATKRLNKIRKGISLSLKASIEVIVKLRNNISHNNIQEIDIVCKKGSSKVSLDANIVKFELKNLAKLYTDSFNEFRNYYSYYG